MDFEKATKELLARCDAIQRTGKAPPVTEILAETIQLLALQAKRIETLERQVQNLRGGSPDAT